MNHKIKVLCFGDSNTWGYNPQDQSRYPEGIRWTGLLQEKLGPNYRVIEEGLNGRTTNIEYRSRPGKSGISYLRPCMDSHFPLSVVILCLGTNDTKVEFNRSAEDIAQGLEEVIQVILGKGLERPSPGLKLVVVTPALVSEGGHPDFLGAEAKTRKLPALYRALAEKYQALFVDLSLEVTPSPLDGCHLSVESHARIADLLFEKIKS